MRNNYGGGGWRWGYVHTYVHIYYESQLHELRPMPCLTCHSRTTAPCDNSLEIQYTSGCSMFLFSSSTSICFSRGPAASSHTCLTLSCQMPSSHPTADWSHVWPLPPTPELCMSMLRFHFCTVLGLVYCSSFFRSDRLCYAFTVRDESHKLFTWSSFYVWMLCLQQHWQLSLLIDTLDVFVPFSNASH